MNEDLFAALQSMNDAPVEREDYLIAPMPYVGAKNRSLNQLLPLLPYTDTWIDAFGGTGSVTLNRRKSKFEVFNDRHAGIVAFYRCIRDPLLYDQLISRLDLTIHSREEFIWSKATWEHNELDPVERAARWYYIAAYSFGAVGRNFGRTKASSSIMAGKLAKKLQHFQPIHERFREVQVENADYRTILKDYDSTESVIYVDPPYYGSNIYKHSFNKTDHIELCERIFECRGFVALSGYENPVYAKFPWDSVHTWKTHVTVTSRALDTDTSGVERLGLDTAHEYLYIKEFES